MSTFNNNNSTSNDNSSTSREEQPSQESKLEFSEDEKTLITLMYKLVGDRWSLIAGRIPGRTAEEIKEYWTTRIPPPTIPKPAGTDEDVGCETKNP